jgi:hypothetical protein
MSTPEVFVEQFTKLFVHYQEALQPAGDESTESVSNSSHDPAPDERERLVAAARLALLELEADAATNPAAGMPAPVKPNGAADQLGSGNLPTAAELCLTMDSALHCSTPYVQERSSQSPPEPHDSAFGHLPRCIA